MICEMSSPPTDQLSTVILTSNISQQIYKGERTKMRRLFIAVSHLDFTKIKDMRK